ncbi:MAG: tRNA (adenosine(37)-N6)-threonylcarbamoyltransferase complex ATPase subunit type 1 TsaE [Candidatus Eisenbacteria bacterium]
MVHLIKLLSRSTHDTMQIGEKLGADLAPGDAVALTGVLGSGKSVLARGILRALGVTGEIPSPSYIIVASYEARLPANHIDLYRLEGPDEAVGIGIEDYLYSGSVNVIEWAEKIGDLLPPSRVDITIDVRKEPDERLITIRPADDDMKARLTGLAGQLIFMEGQ